MHILFAKRRIIVYNYGIFSLVAHSKLS